MFRERSLHLRLLSFLLLALARGGLAHAEDPACPPGTLAQARQREATEEALANTMLRPSSIMPADPAMVLLSPADQAATGVASIRRGERIGAGGMGDVYEAEVIWLDKSRPKSQMVWREVARRPGFVDLPEIRAAEIEGSHLHDLISKEYAAQGRPPSERFVVPLEGRIFTNNADGPVLGLLMPRGGATVSELQRADRLSLINRGDELIGSASELARRIRRNARLAVAQARGLADMRSMGVVHRDIKGANIVIFGGKLNTIEEVDDGTAHFAIIDFGIAKNVGAPPDKKKRFFGSLGYVDPGRLTVVDSANSAEDVFATATVLAENLLGFSAGSARAGRRGGSLLEQAGNYPNYYLSSATVDVALQNLGAAMKTAGVNDIDLQLFEDLRHFIVSGLNPDPVARMNALAKDAIWVTDLHGVKPGFVSRIRTEAAAMSAVPPAPAAQPAKARPDDVPTQPLPAYPAP